MQAVVRDHAHIKILRFFGLITALSLKHFRVSPFLRLARRCLYGGCSAALQCIAGQSIVLQSRSRSPEQLAHLMEISTKTDDSIIHNDKHTILMRMELNRCSYLYLSTSPTKLWPCLSERVCFGRSISAKLLPGLTNLHPPKNL